MEKNDYDYLVKILFLGDSGVGKTSVLQRYTNGTFTEAFVSTVGIDFREKRIMYYNKNPENISKAVGDSPRTLGQRIRLQIWDTAGQERFRSITTSFFRDAMGFVVMYDVTRESTFVNIRHWMEQLRTHSYCEDPTVILVGNKKDLTEERTVDQSAATSYAASLGVKYLEVSALSGENITETIDKLVELIMQKMERQAEIAAMSQVIISDSTRCQEEKDDCGSLRDKCGC